MEPEDLAKWVSDNLPFLEGDDQRAIGTLAMMVRDYSEFMEENNTVDELFSMFISMRYKEIIDKDLH
jgi:hypothetical protein